MFSKFRVSKRSASEADIEDTPGLVLVSSAHIADNGSKRLVQSVSRLTVRSTQRVGRPIHDRKCAGCVKDRQSVVSQWTTALIVSVLSLIPLLIDAHAASHAIDHVCQGNWKDTTTMTLT